MKKNLWWLLAIPVAVGTAFLLKNFVEFECVEEIEEDIPEPDEGKIQKITDNTFNYDEKTLSVMKSHITRNTNQLIEDCNWFAMGKTGWPDILFSDVEVKEIVLLAKSKDLAKITELEQIYTEKYQNDENSSIIDNKNEINTDDGYYYLYVAIG